jgi:hypothetical protein
VEVFIPSPQPTLHSGTVATMPHPVVDLSETDAPVIAAAFELDIGFVVELVSGFVAITLQPDTPDEAPRSRAITYYFGFDPFTGALHGGTPPPQHSGQGSATAWECDAGTSSDAMVQLARRIGQAVAEGKPAVGEVLRRVSIPTHWCIDEDGLQVPSEDVLERGGTIFAMGSVAAEVQLFVPGAQLRTSIDSVAHPSSQANNIF